MDKKEVKSFVNSTASKAAQKANENAKTASGWRKWLWAAGAILAAAVAWFTQGCTPANVEQLQAAHTLYHAISGEPCKISPVVVPTVK